MVVFYCCAGGMTSGLFCKRMESVLDEKIKTLGGHLPDIHRKWKAGKLDEYDLVFACGTGLNAQKSFFEQYDFKNMISLAFVSPQVAFNFPTIKKYMDEYNIPCELIDSKIFGTMDSEKGIEQLNNSIKKHFNKTLY